MQTLIQITMFALAVVVTDKILKRRGEEEMNNTTVAAVLNKSKTDFMLEDFAHLFEEDDELLEFVEDYEMELRDFLRFVLPEVMDRLKTRMAFASVTEVK